MLLDLFTDTGELPSRGSIAQLQDIGTPSELVGIFGGRHTL